MFGKSAVATENEMISGKLSMAPTTPVWSPKRAVALSSLKPAFTSLDVMMRESKVCVNGTMALEKVSGMTAEKNLLESPCEKSTFILTVLLYETNKNKNATTSLTTMPKKAPKTPCAAP